MHTRIVQADARKRMTLAELNPGERYFVEKGSRGDILLTLVSPEASGTRIVKADPRKRIHLSEITPSGVYLVTRMKSGSVRLRAAIVLPQSSTLPVDTS